MTEITTEDIRPVSGDELDAWLADPDTVPCEETVYVCVDGKKRRQYEEVKARIAERAEAAAAEQQEGAERQAQAAATKPVDDRLSTKTPAAPAEIPVPDDTERPLLEKLIREMKTRTVPFLIRAVGSPRWNELQAQHPPRKEPDTGRLYPVDARSGFNASTFYVALLRESIASPPMTDGRYAALLEKLTDAQFTRLAQTAANVNTIESDDLPF